MVEPTAAQEEKEKLILPPVSEANPPTDTKVFVEDDSAATKAALGSGPWGKMECTLIE